MGSIYSKENVDFSDAGTYMCTVSDDVDSFDTAPVLLRVCWNIPAVSLAGLMMLVALTTVAGATLLRRR